MTSIKLATKRWWSKESKCQKKYDNLHINYMKIIYKEKY